MSADADVVASALADVLDTHGYRESCMPLTTMPSIAGGPPTGDEYMAANLPPGCTSEASILLQLFLLGKRIDTSAVEAAVGEAAVASLSACGILIHSDVPDLPSKHSYASMQVYPLVVPGGQPSMLLLCTDWDAVDPLVDAVMPVGVDSLQLALAMPPVASCLAGKRVLDVCCGCGIQGLAAAARGARFVLLSDLSPRAIHFARLNARLNQLNASVVAAEPGSGYTPAKRHLSMTRDLPFDLVLCNPPFVAVPSRLKLDPALYVAGGDDGAELVRSFLDDAPRILSPTGSVLLVAQFPNIDEAHIWLLRTSHDDESQALQEGFELCVAYDPRHTMSTDRYAAARAADYPGCSPREWASAMRVAGVKTMGFGLLVAKRKASASRGRRLLIEVAEGDGSTATMLYGHGLSELRKAVAQSLGAVVVATAPRGTEDLVARGSFGSVHAAPTKCTPRPRSCGANHE